MEGYNEISGYKVITRIPSKGGSSVWFARSSNDSDVVLKILNPSNFQDSIERNSFRRGIESLYLLTQSDIKVAPKYIDHREVPLLSVMENIIGSNLEEFVQRGDYDLFSQGLEVFCNVCEAVDMCHKSDGSVLHRDLKPSNILLENWFSGYELEDINIRLINFDLSWHKFSSGDTKSISADDIGFYAPEQRRLKDSYLPRTARTDTYMLGMVLYFLLRGEKPPEGGANVVDWEKIISREVRSVI